MQLEWVADPTLPLFHAAAPNCFYITAKNPPDPDFISDPRGMQGKSQILITSIHFKWLLSINQLGGTAFRLRFCR